MQALPRLLITLGDVAGIGPEVLLKCWEQSSLFAQSQPVVVGDVGWLLQTARRFGFKGSIQKHTDLSLWPQAQPDLIPVLQSTSVDLRHTKLGVAQASSGQAAYDFLKQAIELTLARQADAIVTLPLHKEGLHLAGLHYPGHTEILAEACGIKKYAMMLYAPIQQTRNESRGGVGVAHVTLHQSMRSIFDSITIASVLDKIELTHEIMWKLVGHKPRIGVCALNPHASDGGLFGNEEAMIIEPAVQEAIRLGILATGPWPSDTLFRRAKAGEYDGIVAMYHDQGHIALKLMSGFHLVNITLGLPIIRTSVAHGTAYDIVEKGTSDPYSLLVAAEVACKLVLEQRHTTPGYV
ncbi:MAG: 4-hydroxythreonine-4-phosphate dehydrogenase PdxA [Gemmatales bacterium]